MFISLGLVSIFFSYPATGNNFTKKERFIMGTQKGEGKPRSQRTWQRPRSSRGFICWISTLAWRFREATEGNDQSSDSQRPFQHPFRAWVSIPPLEWQRQFGQSRAKRQCMSFFRSLNRLVGGRGERWQGSPALGLRPGWIERPST